MIPCEGKDFNFENNPIILKRAVRLFKKLEQEQEILIENERNLRDGAQDERVNQEKIGFYVRKIDEEKRMLNDVLENSRTR